MEVITRNIKEWDYLREGAVKQAVLDKNLKGKWLILCELLTVKEELTSLSTLLLEEDGKRNDRTLGLGGILTG